MQQELNFDIATVTACVATIGNRRARRIIRGLLLTALTEPNLVTDIDCDGCILMTASNATVAAWAEVSEESVRVNAKRLSEIRPTILEKSPTVNTPSEWLLMLNHIMDSDAVKTVVELINNSKKLGVKLPPTFEKLPPTLPPTNAKVGGKVAPNFSNLSSICFQLPKLSLAGLASELSGFGIAVSGDEFAAYYVDDIALEKPEAIAAIARYVATNESETRRVFIAAVVARKKDSPWAYFRWLVITGNYLTTKATKQEIQTAETLLRLTNGTDAAEIIPTTADEAWSRVLAAVRKFSTMHQLREIREVLGDDIYNAVRSAGGFSSIGTADQWQQNANRKAFIDAYTASQTITEAIR